MEELSFWENTLRSLLKKEGIKDVPDGHLALLSKLYEQRGGTWSAFLQGNMQDVALLKRICIIYAKRRKRVEV